MKEQAVQDKEAASDGEAMLRPARNISAERPSISIIIKAKNEEHKITRALLSAIAAAARVGGEVILADSASTDRTAAIALEHDVAVVRLSDAREACCGIGPELGFRYAAGEWVCIMDADMAIRPNFLVAAIKAMVANDRVAGIGGRLVEIDARNLQAARRALDVYRSGPIRAINGLGVYRAAALHEVGYFSDRNLHSYEEFDLAARLRVRGWELQRIDSISATHEGHKDANYALLRRRWRTRYAWGSGELLRSAIGRPHFGIVLGHPDIRLWCMVVIWWVAILTLPIAAWVAGAGLGFSLLATLALAVLPFAAMSLKRQSLTLGVYSVVSWLVFTAGMLAGLSRSRREPTSPIAAELIRPGG